MALVVHSGCVLRVAGDDGEARNGRGRLALREFGVEQDTGGSAGVVQRLRGSAATGRVRRFEGGIAGLGDELGVLA